MNKNIKTARNTMGRLTMLYVLTLPSGAMFDSSTSDFESFVVAAVLLDTAVDSSDGLTVELRCAAGT